MKRGSTEVTFELSERIRLVSFRKRSSVGVQIFDLDKFWCCCVGLKTFSWRTMSVLRRLIGVETVYGEKCGCSNFLLEKTWVLKPFLRNNV